MVSPELLETRLCHLGALGVKWQTGVGEQDFRSSSFLENSPIRRREVRKYIRRSEGQYSRVYNSPPLAASHSCCYLLVRF